MSEDHELYNAVIDVLCGMSLMRAHELYKDKIKTTGRGRLSAYGVLRHAIMRFCSHRNKEAFEKLRDQDAGRPKASEKKQAADVSYETLQLHGHLFLEPREVTLFQDTLRQRFNESEEVMSEEDEDWLVQTMTNTDARIKKLSHTLTASGIRNDSTLLQLRELLDMQDYFREEAAMQIKALKKRLALSKAGEKNQRLQRIAAFHKRA